MRHSTKVKSEVADLNRKRAADEAFRAKVFDYRTRLWIGGSIMLWCVVVYGRHDCCCTR